MFVWLRLASFVTESLLLLWIPLAIIEVTEISAKAVPRADEGVEAFVPPAGAGEIEEG